MALIGRQRQCLGLQPQATLLMLVICTLLGSANTRVSHFNGKPEQREIGVTALPLTARICDAAHADHGTHPQPPPPPPPPHLRNVFWLHVPKCGTSFGLAILNFACPELPKSVFQPATGIANRADPTKLGKMSIMAHVMRRVLALPPDTCNADAFEQSRSMFHHAPLPDHLVTSKRGLALFRDPRVRLYSSFASRHAQGMAPKEKRRLRETVRTVHDYALFPGIAGCQVKMMLGKECAAAYSPNAAGLIEAKRRLVASLGFVGLTEHYDLSVCLLHAMWGGTPQETSFQNVRPTSKFATGYNSTDAARHLRFEDDPLDAELYFEARRIFVTRLREHGLAVPADLLPGPNVTSASTRAPELGMDHQQRQQYSLTAMPVLPHPPTAMGVRPLAAWLLWLVVGLVAVVGAFRIGSRAGGRFHLPRFALS